jgi:UDP-N-acetylmuramoylalanine--D-glutamate ligase
LTDAPSWLPVADAASPWEQVHAVVAGLGRAGEAAASALLSMGARVTVLDAADGDRQRRRADVLTRAGASVHLGGEPSLPDDTQLVVASPGLPPTHVWLVDAGTRGTAVWSGEQLAWHLQPTRSPAPWLTVTGTNGKTTTVQMLTAILTAGGERAAAAGNIGWPLVEAVRADPPYDVLAVELSSFQLHFTRGVQAQASALLNIGADHLDWHGGFEAYAADKARVFDGTRKTMVFNADDDVVQRLVRRAAPATRAARVGFTLEPPRPGMLGVEDGHLVDAAFGSPSARRVRLLARDELSVTGEHNTANALAAAALALAHGAAHDAVAAGLRGFTVDAHRGATVGRLGPLTFVDDSKATNADAALVSLRAHDHVVWIAGGLAKGASFDDLTREVAARLQGVVLIGRDRAVVHEALRRHAPQVRVIEVDAGETEVMDLVVDAAVRLAAPTGRAVTPAQPGPGATVTVLLAPACASTDQFSDYAARGDAFAAAVRRRVGLHLRDDQR